MKTIKRNLTFLVLAVILVTGLQLMSSCKKNDPAPTIDEFVDISATEELVSMLDEVASYDDFSADFIADAGEFATVFEAANLDVELEEIAAVDLDDVIGEIEDNIRLSTVETMKLKDNDQLTYATVIERMAQRPSFISDSDMEKLKSAMGDNAALSSYMLNIRGYSADLNADDYYQGVLDFKSYIVSYIIPAYEKIKELNALAEQSAVALKSTTVTERIQLTATLIAIVTIQLDDYGNVIEESITYDHNGGN